MCGFSRVFRMRDSTESTIAMATDDPRADFNHPWNLPSKSDSTDASGGNTMYNIFPIHFDGNIASTDPVPSKAMCELQRSVRQFERDTDRLIRDLEQAWRERRWLDSIRRAALRRLQHTARRRLATIIQGAYRRLATAIITQKQERFRWSGCPRPHHRLRPARICAHRGNYGRRGL